MVTTNKISINDTQKKIRKESKHVHTKKKKKINKIQRKRAREKKRDRIAIRQTEKNRQNGNTKSFPISNYFKYK